MRARLTNRNSFRQLAILTLTVASSLILQQSASALEIVSHDLQEIGYEQWLLTGQLGPGGAYADITFGEALDGHSTGALIGGEFEYYFSVPYGSVISFTATTLAETSPTHVDQLPGDFNPMDPAAP
jgi:hypothetical protein